jgi:hypothetical protein
MFSPLRQRLRSGQFEIGVAITGENCRRRKNLDGEALSRFWVGKTATGGKLFLSNLTFREDLGSAHTLAIVYSAGYIRAGDASGVPFC